MTRPKRLGAGLVVLSAHVSRDLRHYVQELAKERGWTVSMVVIEAIRRGLNVSEAAPAAQGNGVAVQLSEVERRFLDHLVSLGIYGRTRAEVVLRCVDHQFQAFTGAPRLAQEIPGFLGEIPGSARSRCPKTGRQG